MQVAYSDVTLVGKVVRQRRRRYAYEADHDYVARDWERAIEAHTHARPVKYNNSMVKGKIPNKHTKNLENQRISTVQGPSSACS